MKTKQEMQEAINALRSEVDGSIVDDIQKRFDTYANDVEGRLLECCKNLGHPAYEHSFATHDAIDRLREVTFDYLEVPKV